MEKDITEIFQNYRECVRHLWNTYFRNIEDGWHSFINVEREIYESLVLGQIYNNYNITRDEGEYVKSFVVRPLSRLHHVSVLLGNETENEIKWNDIEITISKTELRFMDYYDWDDTEFRDYTYMKCRVISCEDNKDIINKDILIKSEEVKISYVEIDK